MEKTIEKVQALRAIGVMVEGITVHKVFNQAGVLMGEFGAMHDIPRYMQILIQEGFAEVKTEDEIIIIDPTE